MTPFKEKAYYYRGKYIDCFNILEKTIEEYLIAHFNISDSLYGDFMSIILYRMTCQSKMDSFIAITKNKAVFEGFIKTNNSAWPDNKIYKLLQEAKDERNKFAHYYLMEPTDTRDYIIILAEFRDSIKLHGYTKDKFNRLIENIAEVTFLINEKSGGR